MGVVHVYDYRCHWKVSTNARRTHVRRRSSPSGWDPGISMDRRPYPRKEGMPWLSVLLKRKFIGASVLIVSRLQHAPQNFYCFSCFFQWKPITSSRRHKSRPTPITEAEKLLLPQPSAGPSWATAQLEWLCSSLTVRISSHYDNYLRLVSNKQQTSATYLSSSFVRKEGFSSQTFSAFFWRYFGHYLRRSWAALIFYVSKALNLV